MLSLLYGRLAALRRAWYGRDPARRRTLDRPVISVGNLVVGGSGKTPLVATLARLLVSAGERPSVLSRGYGRRRGADGVVVVSDGQQVLEPADISGDEPQMLARTLAGVPVLVCADRYLAGRLAETRFGCTVHLLDDGFQHLPLARDVDLLIVGRDDLEARVLPFGRLREGLGAARDADALLVPGEDEEASVIAHVLGVSTVFRVRWRHGPLQGLAGQGSDVVPNAPAGARTRVVGVAGIARPRRFYEALRSQGFDVARELSFRDHHWFTPRDLERVARVARQVQAEAVVTTEKDAMRLDAVALARAAGRPVLWLPLQAEVVDADRFAGWLADRLRAAKIRRGLAA